MNTNLLAIALVNSNCEGKGGIKTEENTKIEEKERSIVDIEGVEAEKFKKGWVLYL